MKILHCINSLSSGGAEVFVCALAIAQKRAGHDVRVMTYGGTLGPKGRSLEERLHAEGVAYHGLGITRKWATPVIPLRFAREFRRLQPDVVHSHLAQTDFYVWLGARLARIDAAFVRTIHGMNVFEGLPLAAHRALARFYHAGVACGEVVYRSFPYLGPRGRLINNGIDLDQFVVRDTAPPPRPSGLPSPGSLLLVSVGSFVLHDGELVKGQDVTVRALQKLKNSDVSVVFVGGGDRLNEVQSLVQSLALAEHFTFTGQVTNALDYVYAADGVLMPSRSEGLSIACLEAVCAGKPVIVTDIAAFEPFRRASTVVVAPASPDSLAEGIGRFVAQKDQLQVHAREERDQYREEFDINSVAERYIACYRELAD